MQLSKLLPKKKNLLHICKAYELQISLKSSKGTIIDSLIYHIPKCQCIPNINALSNCEVTCCVEPRLLVEEACVSDVESCGASTRSDVESSSAPSQAGVQSSSSTQSDVQCSSASTQSGRKILRRKKNSRQFTLGRNENTQKSIS